MAASRYSSYVLSVSETDDVLAEIASTVDELNDLEDAGLLIAEISAWPLFIRVYSCTARFEYCNIGRYILHRVANSTIHYPLYLAPERIQYEGMDAALSVVCSYSFWSMPHRATSAQ